MNHLLPAKAAGDRNVLILLAERREIYELVFTILFFNNHNRIISQAATEVTGKLRKNSHNTEARKIEDHKNWDGKLNYIKAGFMACRGKAIAADYVEPDMTDDITAVVTSLGSKLKNRDGFRRIIDLVGDEIAAPEDI